MSVRTRFAPSPTGDDIHIGNLSTVLKTWAFAKKNDGQFILRIEDTDQERLVEGSELKIEQVLKRFGLNYDEGPDVGGEYGPYRQSERLEIYKKHAEELINKGFAYYCFCSKERIEELRKQEEQKEVKTKHLHFCDQSNIEERLLKKDAYVIRLKVPEHQDITFDDIIRGKITINTDQIDDQILLKSDGFPTYHLAVVVDDYLMKINYITRADEWISSTPKHILLYQAFGWELPVFCHLPLLRNTDKSKLSKRKNAVWVSWYLEQGYLKEAILNYLALMGWTHPDQKEIFSMEEFVEKFALEDIHPVGPIFDIQKLEWMNGEYIRAMSDEELTQRLEEFLVDHPAKDKIEKLVPLVKERIKKLSDFIPLTDFIWENVEYDLNDFNKVKVENTKEVLEKIYQTLETLEESWSKDKFESAFQELAKSLNLGNREMFQLIRLAVSGQLVTPPLFECIEIIGKDKVLKRVKYISEKYPNIPDSRS